MKIVFYCSNLRPNALQKMEPFNQAVKRIDEENRTPRKAYEAAKDQPGTLIEAYEGELLSL